MAWAYGYQDGDQLPQAALDGSLRSRVRVLGVPLTVDIEGGYSDDLEHVAEVVDTVIESRRILHGAMSGLAHGFLDSGRLPVDGLKAFTYGELNELMRP